MFDSIILIENKLISRTFHVLDTITEKYSSLHYSKTMLKIPEGGGGGGSCRVLVLKLTFVIIIIMIVMIIMMIIIIIALIEIISQPFLANDHRLPP